MFIQMQPFSVVNYITKMNLSKTFVYRQNGITGTGPTFLPKTTKKGNKIYATMVCRYCMLGRAEQRSLKTETN